MTLLGLISKATKRSSKNTLVKATIYFGRKTAYSKYFMHTMKLFIRAGWSKTVVSFLFTFGEL